MQTQSCKFDWNELTSTLISCSKPVYYFSAISFFYREVYVECLPENELFRCPFQHFSISDLTKCFQSLVAKPVSAVPYQQRILTLLHLQIVKNSTAFAFFTTHSNAWLHKSGHWAISVRFEDMRARSIVIRENKTLLIVFHDQKRQSEEPDFDIVLPLIN